MKEKLSLVTELIKMANCDHDLREKEYEFIQIISHQLGVKKEVMDNLFDQYIEFTPPPFEFNRILQFHRLVLLMNIDGEANQEELCFIRNLGVKMGLNPLSIEKILSEMNNYPNKVIPSDTLIEIFRQHYN